RSRIPEVADGSDLLAIEQLRQAANDRAREARPLINHAGIELHEIGTGLDLLERGFGGRDAADADDRQAWADAFAHFGENGGRFVEQRLLRETPPPPRLTLVS